MRGQHRAPGDARERHASASGGDPNADPGSGGIAPVTHSQAPVCSTGPKGRSYTSLDGHPLEADRQNLDLGVEIQLIRNPEQLIEGQRTGLGQDFYQLGLYTNAFSSSFGILPLLDLEHWYQTPQPGVSLSWGFFYTAYRACLEQQQHPVIYMPPVAWQSTPTAATARDQCRRFMRNIWWEEPTDEEVAACADFAVNEIPALVPDPQQQWAYVCASVMTSANFIAY